jgi:hypothetical protein
VDNPSDILRDLKERDSEYLKHRFQRQIQKKMNVFNKYHKQVKDHTPIYGVNTDEKYHNPAADNYRDADGQAFHFSHHCVEVLQQFPEFNLMADDTDGSPELL